MKQAVPTPSALPRPSATPSPSLPAALAALLVLLGTCAHAEGDATAWEVEAGAGSESLSNDSPGWHEADLAVRARFAPRSVAEGGLTVAQRYGRTDHELSAGIAMPLDAGGLWNGSLRVTAVDSPNFLPRTGVAATLGRNLGDGWIASAGLGRNLYANPGVPSSGTTAVRLGAERYVGSWRLAGGWTRGRLDGGATADGGTLQADYYVGDRGRVGVLVYAGRELENDPSGILSSRVTSLALTGRWPVSQDWALVGSIGQTRIESLTRLTGDVGAPAGPGYRRTGGRVGVQHEF